MKRQQERRRRRRRGTFIVHKTFFFLWDFFSHLQSAYMCSYKYRKNIAIFLVSLDERRMHGHITKKKIWRRNRKEWCKRRMDEERHKAIVYKQKKIDDIGMFCCSNCTLFFFCTEIECKKHKKRFLSQM